jgi:prolipoprotein diacylglyceryl transferase
MSAPLFALMAAIPSPSSNAIHLGPLQLRAYGLAIAVGAVTAVWVAQRRWAARGGDPADLSRLATWSILAGVLGARAYHVITDHQRFTGRWPHALAIWEGGLGIPGGLLAGVLTGVILARHRGLPAARLLDMVAPAIPIAQAIGRLGNWFNQELFGRPTDLPWALRIDPSHRPPGFEQFATYHPTFLYEALWNLALVGALLLYERRTSARHRPGHVFALYVGGYGLGRLWVEALRIDAANTIGGLRINIWVSLLAMAGAAAWLAWNNRRPSQPHTSGPPTGPALDHRTTVDSNTRPASIAAKEEQS